jgi:transcriptional regulator with XRE-family HTH domain
MKSSTPSQCRAARGLLAWTQNKLARMAGISIVTVRNFETEKTTPQRASLDIIRRALQSAGVIFVEENGEGPGVRLRKAAK